MSRIVGTSYHDRFTADNLWLQFHNDSEFKISVPPMKNLIIQHFGIERKFCVSTHF